MSYPLNPHVRAVVAPPIAAVQAWVRGRVFPAARPLLDVAQAVPSYPPAESLVAHVAQVARRPETSVYSAILGLPALREALAAHLGEDYAAPIAASRVVITAGCNQAFCVAMAALAAPGDEVIMPIPYYFNHPMWLAMQGVRPVHPPFDPETGGLCRPESVVPLITERTRAIALISPNNPTGAIYPPELLAEFAQVAREHRLALVLDETYKDFRTAPGPAHDLFQDPDWPEYLVQLYSFSKAYSLTGYRVGSIVCGPRLVAEVEKLLDCLSICAPRISQEAACFALADLAGWREAKADLMAARVAALKRAFLRNDLRYRLLSAGAYFAYVEHPFAERPSAEVARRLADDFNVLCVPGATFGPGQEAYLRFAFANLDTERIPLLVQRLVDSQESGLAG